MAKTNKVARKVKGRSGTTKKTNMKKTRSRRTAITPGNPGANTEILQPGNPG